MSKKSDIEKLVGVATLPPSFLPIGICILIHKQATQTKHFNGECIANFDHLNRKLHIQTDTNVQQGMQGVVA